MHTIGMNVAGASSAKQNKAALAQEGDAVVESGVQAERVVEVIDRFLVRMVPLAEIAFARRSKDVSEFIEVFNPRDEEDFHHWTMEELERSIAQDGLLQFPNIRLVEKKGKQTYELLAGERRIRALSNLAKRNAQVYDEATDKIMPASVLYATVPCRVVKHVDDMKALRIAFQENHSQKRVSDRAQIFFCEYLLSQKAPGENRILTRKEVAAHLGVSESWLCQTLALKTKLSPQLLQSLFDQQITRSYAIDLMGYDEKDREPVNEAAHQIAHDRYETTLERAEAEEAEAQIALEVVQELETQAPSAKKKATAHTKVERAKKKVDVAHAKVKDLEEQGVKVQQSDLAAGAIEIGIQPLGIKGLSSKQLHDHWLTKIGQHLIADKVRHPTTSRVYPKRDILLLKYAAQAMADGETEPLKVLDAFYKAQGGWGMFGSDGFTGGNVASAAMAFNRTPIDDIEEEEDLDDLDIDDLDIDAEFEGMDLGELDDEDEGDEEEKEEE